MRQVQLLDVSRSWVYYRPQPTSEADLALMRRIDELHLEHPFAGSRMLRDLLRRDSRADPALARLIRDDAQQPVPSQPG